MFANAAAETSSSLITIDKIKLFHEIDRNLYSLLIDDLLRDPLESMRAMALWLWLEHIGFDNVVRKKMSLPHFLINDLAAEAIYCINCLTKINILTPPPEQQIELALTQGLLGNAMPPNFFYENRSFPILGIGKTMSEVCDLALSDLQQQAMARKRARQLEETQIAMSLLIEPQFSLVNVNNFERMNPRVNNLPATVDPDERTMFVTFSRGYPVLELDIHEFFYLNYGDCIEIIHMQEVQTGGQSLYARIVFYTSDVIAAVLNGAEKAKFTIKGTHIWMCKFVARNLILLQGDRYRGQVGPGQGTPGDPFGLYLGRGLPGGPSRVYNVVAYVLWRGLFFG